MSCILLVSLLSNFFVREMIVYAPGHSGLLNKSVFFLTMKGRLFLGLYACKNFWKRQYISERAFCHSLGLIDLNLAVGDGSIILAHEWYRCCISRILEFSYQFVL